MRPGQQKNRMRGRGRKGPNPLSRNYESNGPDVKIRGNAQHIADKYAQLARDASASGDRVMAENYLQHSEHYFRIVAAAQPQGQNQRDDRDQRDDEDDDSDTGNDRFDRRDYGNYDSGQSGNGQSNSGQSNSGQSNSGQSGNGERSDRRNNQSSEDERQPRSERRERDGNERRNRDNRGRDREGNRDRAGRDDRPRRDREYAAASEDEGPAGTGPQPEIADLSSSDRGHSAGAAKAHDRSNESGGEDAASASRADAANGSTPAETSSDNDIAAEEAPKRKRGRPRKTAPKADQADAAGPNDEGEPQAKRRPGRPRKVKPENEPKVEAEEKNEEGSSQLPDFLFASNG